MKKLRAGMSAKVGAECLVSKNIKINIHRTINLLVVSYGCETWSYIERERYRLRLYKC